MIFIKVLLLIRSIKVKLGKILFSKIGPKFCQLAVIPFQKIAKNPFETLPPLGKILLDFVSPKLPNNNEVSCLKYESQSNC